MFLYWVWQAPSNGGRGRDRTLVCSCCHAESVREREGTFALALLLTWLCACVCALRASPHMPSYLGQEEFDEVCKQREMVAKLNRLDSMLETRELVAGKDLYVSARARGCRRASLTCMLMVLARSQG